MVAGVASLPLALNTPGCCESSDVTLARLGVSRADLRPPAPLLEAGNSEPAVPIGFSSRTRAVIASAIDRKQRSGSVSML